MKYWTNLFTGTTYREFRDAGGTVSGHTFKKRNTALRVKKGDILLCYVTGVQVWVGALEVVGPSKETHRIWKGEEYPVRLEVKPLILLDPQYGVPMDNLRGEVHFYSSAKDKGKFRGIIRSSLNQFTGEDGERVWRCLVEAKDNPVFRPVDPKQLARKPFYKVESKHGSSKVTTVVSVPESEETTVPSPEPMDSGDTASTRHSEIQHQLLTLGADLGCDVWVARNDRNRKWKGMLLGNLPRMLNQLPTQFNDATTRTIELIDVLWLSGNSIMAAFEVECTTSVYSGLLRMSDLLALQPNLEINLYLVAPDERRDKVKQELLRPTFSLRDKPLAKLCGFLAFGVFCEKLEGIRKLKLTGNLNPAFLKNTAEYFAAEEKS